jgi:hypothetical protein
MISKRDLTTTAPVPGRKSVCVSHISYIDIYLYVSYSYHRPQTCAAPTTITNTKILILIPEETMSNVALANPNGTNVPNIIPLEEGWNNEIKAKVRWLHDTLRPVK